MPTRETDRTTKPGLHNELAEHELHGDHARDTWRHGFGGDHARDPHQEVDADATQPAFPNREHIGKASE